MKFFSSEFAHNYGTYSFGYCNYCARESGDALHDIYNLGYLPYSGSKDIRDTFYMARSTRISLENWDLSSENRRVLQKHENAISRTLYKREDFLVTEDFITFCLGYFAEHHGSHTMPRERLMHILDDDSLTHVVEYRSGDTLAGYTFLVADNLMSHVWFYFYAREYSQSSFGIWVLLNEARVAQEEQKGHFYLGTAYGDKSRYKTNFSHLEFWDGATWKEDKNNREIKSRIKNDHLDLIDSTDAFKSNQKNFFT